MRRLRGKLYHGTRSVEERIWCHEETINGDCHGMRRVRKSDLYHEKHGRMGSSWYKTETEKIWCRDEKKKRGSSW